MPPDFDENPKWTAETSARSRPAKDVLSPELLASLKRGRGPNKAPTKQQVTLRLDRDVLAKWRGTGPGWQGRVNAALAAADVGACVADEAA